MLKSIKAPQLQVLLRQHRLRYFVRFLVKAPPFLVRLFVLLMGHVPSWPNTICCDLKLIWQSSDELSGMLPDPAQNMREWTEAIIANSNKFRSLFIRLAIATVPKVLDENQPEVVAQDECEVKEHAFCCYHCGLVFDTKQKCSSHAYSKHRTRHPMRSRIFTTYCLCCNTEYYSDKRIFGHLDNRRGKSKCFEYYMEHVDPISDEHVSEVRATKIAEARSVDVKSVPPPPVKLHLV